MDRRWLANKPAEKGRPKWGFCRVRVETICRLWTAYRCRELQRQDVQVWFAIQELVTRRCTLGPSRKPFYSEQEVEPLTGLRPAAIRASIQRLERTMFLAWSDGRVTVKDGCNANVVAQDRLRQMFSAVTNHRRTLPVPRHTVLLLARTRRPVMLATLLGHLFRCVYYRSRECVSWGTCKASWISEAFGVDVRNVKAARRELEGLGWVRQLKSNHWHRQRYGGTYVVALGWSGSNSQQGPISPPRNNTRRPKSPPPESYGNLPSGNKNQNRPMVPSAGVERHKAGREGKPRLGRVLPADLTDPRRTAQLFAEAAAAGLVKDTTADRLRFFAAAERAKRLGANPGGFFVAILWKGLWQNIATCDEEQARRELGRLPELLVPPALLHPKTSRAEPRPMSPERDESDPSTIRELVRRSLASVDGRWREALTHSAPSHLVVDRSFPAERYGVKEGTRVRTG